MLTHEAAMKEPTNAEWNSFRRERRIIDRRVEFLLDRCHGIPISTYLSKQTHDVYREYLTEDQILTREELYFEYSSMQSGVLYSQFGREILQLRQELAAYRKPIDTSTERLYSSIAAWSRTEALSLWLGRIPPEKLDLNEWAVRNQRLTAYAAEVVFRNNLIVRALDSRQLESSCSACSFVQWALSTGLSAPDMFHIIHKRKGFSDSSFVDQDKVNDELLHLKMENSRLKFELQELNKKEYKQYKEMFGALCLGVYGFTPGIRNTKASPKIREVLRLYDDKRDPGTVLDYVKKAISALPDSTKKNLVQSYLDSAAIEGEFQPDVEDSPTSPQIPLRRRR